MVMKSRMPNAQAVQLQRECDDLRLLTRGSSQLYFCAVNRERRSHPALCHRPLLRRLLGVLRELPAVGVLRKHNV